MTAELVTRGPWNFDALTTEHRVGLGISRDVGKHLDVGLYGVTPYDEWAPEVGVGIHFGW